MSLQGGMLPLEWKETNIIPLFKNGSTNKSVNFRQVSLTSVICKILVAILRDQQIQINKLFSECFFFKARSCLTDVVCFLGNN